MDQRKNYVRGGGNFAVALLGILCGGLMLTLGIRDYLRFQATPGRVTWRGIVANQYKPGGREEIVQFTYAVGGKAYTGRFPPESSRMSSMGMSPAWRLPLSPGTPVTVFYDPQNPQRCDLDKGFDGSAWAFVAFGISFALMGWAFLVGHPLVRAPDGEVVGFFKRTQSPSRPFMLVQVFVPVGLMALPRSIAMPHALTHALGIFAVMLVPAVFVLLKRRAEKRWSPLGWIDSQPALRL